MGRVIQREVIAVRCEVATPRGRTASQASHRCGSIEAVWPQPAEAGWEDMLADLIRLTARGWAFVLTPQLRAYCPDHAGQVTKCSCRTNPDRAHLCVVHGPAAELVWSTGRVPGEVSKEITRRVVSG